MTLAHVTHSGNISLPKSWREELGIEPDSEVLIEKTGTTIIIEPLKPKTLQETFKSIDEEIRRKKIVFTRTEAVTDDFFD